MLNIRSSSEFQGQSSAHIHILNSVLKDTDLFIWITLKYVKQKYVIYDDIHANIYSNTNTTWIPWYEHSSRTYKY